MSIIIKPNPELDLVLERIVDVPPEWVWEAWTKPEHIVHWFTPDPWKTIDAEIDLRAGGIFRTTMQSPEGEKFPNTGCILEVIENKRLVWTDALEPGFRPAGKAILESFSITAVISLEAHGKGTKYTAMSLHKDLESRKKHEEMGFHDGWGTVLTQLVEYMKKTKK